MSPLQNGEAFNSANPGRKCGMLLGGPPFQSTKSLYFLALRRIFGLSRPRRYLRPISYLLVTKGYSRYVVADLIPEARGL